jgi:hypothetical protein
MQLPESIQNTINSLNLQGATVEEIIKDLVDQSNQFSLRLMIATALLEKLTSDERHKQLQPGGEQEPGSV